MHLKIIRIELYVTAKKELLDTVQSVFRIPKGRGGGEIKNENLCDMVTNIFNLEKIPTISDQTYAPSYSRTVYSSLPLEGILMLAFNGPPYYRGMTVLIFNSLKALL